MDGFEGWIVEKEVVLLGTLRLFEFCVKQHECKSITIIKESQMATLVQYHYACMDLMHKLGTKLLFVCKSKTMYICSCFDLIKIFVCLLAMGTSQWYL